MARIQQQDNLLHIHSDWFSLLVPGVWEKQASDKSVSEKSLRENSSAPVFHGTRKARTLAVHTHTLPAAPNAELRTLALREILNSYAKAETFAAAIDEGPVETSPGGAIITLAYSLDDSARGSLACVKLVSYGRRCVAVRLAADLSREPRETLGGLERDTEAILDGLSILQFERVSVAQLQRRMTWLLALNLLLLCGALLLAAKCYTPDQSVDLAAMRQKAVGIQDAESGRVALRESVDFFDFWFDRAASFRREMGMLLVIAGGIAVANIAAFWWMRRIVRHPWDDIVDRE